MSWQDVIRKYDANKEIIGYDVVYVKDGKTKRKAFRNLEKIPTRYGGMIQTMPDIRPAKSFARGGKDEKGDRISIGYIEIIYADGSSGSYNPNPNTPENREAMRIAREKYFED